MNVEPRAGTLIRNRRPKRDKLVKRGKKGEGKIDLQTRYVRLNWEDSLKARNCKKFRTGFITAGSCIVAGD